MNVHVSTCTIHSYLEHTCTYTCNIHVRTCQDSTSLTLLLFYSLTLSPSALLPIPPSLYHSGTPAPLLPLYLPLSRTVVEWSPYSSAHWPRHCTCGWEWGKACWPREAGSFCNRHTHTYCIAGYFRGVYISRISKLLRFTELIFAKLIENHTHVPSVVTLQVQSSRNFSFREIREIFSPLENNPQYGIFMKSSIIRQPPCWGHLSNEDTFWWRT